MPKPKLEVIGIYRPQISAETWQEQWGVTAADQATQKQREHFEQLVLIEAIVSDLNEPFKMGKFGQMAVDHFDDARYMQIGYDEGLLSADGEMLIQRDMDCVDGTGNLRFAVYLHFYDPERPLQWQNGTINCPPIEEIPPRLQILMPYTACT